MVDEDTAAYASRVRDRIKTIVNQNPTELNEPEILYASDWREDLRQKRARRWDDRVPVIWRGWGIDDLPPNLQQEAVDYLRDFEDAQNLILLGPGGRGKTTMAYAIAREAFLMGKDTEVVVSPALFDSLRSPESAQGAMERACAVDLLVLDDLGSERHTEWLEERMFLLVDHRYQWKRPTIITSNLPQEVLEERISSRILGRLFDNARVVVIKGQDYRAN